MSAPTAPRLGVVAGMSTGQLILLANIVAYAVCYQAQQPALPYIIGRLSADAKGSFADFKSLFWSIQFVGSLIAGGLIDSLGANVVLYISFAASAVSYALTAYAVDSASLPLVFLGIVPTALQHAVMAARVWTTIVTPADGPERAAGIAYVSVAYGVGMVVGPVLGGWLSSRSLALASWVAAAGSVVSLLCVPLIGQPTPRGAGATDEAGKAGAVAPAPPTPTLASVRTALSSPTLLPLLLSKTLSTLASTLFSTVISFVGAERYGLDVAGMGFFLSYVGGLGILASLFLVKPLSARYQGRDAALTVLCAAASAALFAAFAFTTTQAEVYALYLPISAVSTVFSTANSAALTRAVPLELTGSVVAVDMALGSLARAASPYMCAWLLATYGFASVGGVAAGLCLLLVALLGSGAMRVDEEVKQAPHTD